MREGKEKLSSWEKLKKKMRRKYVPSNYTQQLSMQWNTLTQGSKTVAQYIQEWERLVVLCDIRDSEDMRVGKFLGGEHALLLEQYSKKRASQPAAQSVHETPGM